MKKVMVLVLILGISLCSAESILLNFDGSLAENVVDVQENFVEKVSFEGEPFDFVIDSYEREGNSFVVKYSLSEFSGEEREVFVKYYFRDLGGFARYEDSFSVVLSGEVLSDEFSFDLPKNSFGEFVLEVNVADDSFEKDVFKSVFLPYRTGFSGFAVSEGNRETLSVFGGVFVFLIFVFVLVKLFSNFKKKTHWIKHSSGKHKRMLLELDL